MFAAGPAFFRETPRKGVHFTPRTSRGRDVFGALGAACAHFQRASTCPRHVVSTGNPRKSRPPARTRP